MAITMEQGESSNVRLPKFVKVYNIPLETENDLELPVFFTRALPNPVPRIVTVRSIYGKKWRMELLRKCSGDNNIERFVLFNGWKRIVEGEGLTGGDLTVFEFDGSSSINFCIYKGDTMCKRVRGSAVARDEVSDDDENVIVLTSDDETNDVDYNDADDDDIESVDVEDNVEDDIEADDDDDDDDDDEDYRKYLDDRFNPYFWTTLNPKRSSQLHIPAQVINDYGLTFPESITVVDPLVTKYGTLEKKMKIQENGCVFVKGFGSVIRRNNIKVTDKMVCELKKTGNNPVHTLRVHVING